MGTGKVVIREYWYICTKLIEQIDWENERPTRFRFLHAQAGPSYTPGRSNGDGIVPCEWDMQLFSRVSRFGTLRYDKPRCRFLYVA